MIATVRIAPVERWCGEHKRRAEYHVLAGIEIEIIASRSRIQKAVEPINRHGYDCRVWRLAPSAVEKIENILGRKMRFSHDPDGGIPAICEHMLEMD